MSRQILIALALLLSILPAPQAGADPESRPRSRLIAAILEQFAPGYGRFCFIGTEVSRRFKYRPFELPPVFHERFITGRFVGIHVNDPGCPMPGGAEDDCLWGCVVFLVFDQAALGYPTSWEQWPNCIEEKITFSSSYGPGPRGRLVFSANIYRDGLPNAHEIGTHNYLTVVELGRCAYSVHDERVIE